MRARFSTQHRCAGQPVGTDRNAEHPFGAARRPARLRLALITAPPGAPALRVLSHFPSGAASAEAAGLWAAPKSHPENLRVLLAGGQGWAARRWPARRGRRGAAGGPPSWVPMARGG